MAFEQVYLRTVDGQQYGPVTMSEMLQWHAQGRVPADGVLVDAATGETRPVRDVPALLVPPPPMPGQAPPRVGVGIDRLTPASNPKASWAFTLGLCSLACCVVPIPSLGPAALILGILGLGDVARTGVGRIHAIAGIVLGGLVTLANIIFIVLILSGALDNI